MIDKINSRHIAELVLHANLNRSLANLHRRVGKLLEEIGETNQAYLCVTSASPSKAKTWDDVREEATDVLIVALDILLTPGIDGNPEIDTYTYMTPHDNDDILRMLRNVARWGCDIADYLFISHQQTRRQSEEMVRHAFILTDRVFQDDASLIQEVERKLAKWIRSQNHPIESADVHPG